MRKEGLCCEVMYDESHFILQCQINLYQEQIEISLLIRKLRVY